MQRRNFLKNSVAGSIALHPLMKSFSKNEFLFINNRKLNGPPKPVFVYNDWSSYDELSDNIPLSEELAMKELNEVLRLKKNGVQIDYYLMDAFWFDKNGGYRTWHKEHWSNGPNNWFNGCRENNILVY